MKIVGNDSRGIFTKGGQFAPTPEALVISAVVNSGDISELKACGISLEHFVGYPQHFSWLLNQVERYGHVPTPAEFRTQFKDFPLVTEDVNMRISANMLMASHFKRLGKQTILNATSALANDDLLGAHAAMQTFQPREVSPGSEAIISNTSFLDSYYDNDESASSIAFPWPKVQNVTGGMRPGNLIYMAARPGQGKSSLAIDAAAFAVEQGKRVKYYSLEMNEMEMRYKIHARIARQLGFTNISVEWLRQRRVERDAYKLLLEEISKQAHWASFDLHTPRNGGLVRPSTVYSDAEDYDLVVVDLVTLMANDKGQPSISDWRVAAEISNNLKQIALATNTPILGTLQINRQGQGIDGMPGLHHLGQSDAFGQDADGLIILRNYENKVIRGKVAKARFGNNEDFFVKFDANTMHFPEIDRDHFDILQASAND